MHRNGRKTAKDKLNAANLLGAFVGAVIVAVAFNSVYAFVIAFVVLVGAAFMSGDLR